MPMGSFWAMYFDSSLLPSYLVQWTSFMCYWAVNYVDIIIISWRFLLPGSPGVGFTPHVITVKAGEVCFSAFSYVFMDLIFTFSLVLHLNIAEIWLYFFSTELLKFAYYNCSLGLEHISGWQV
jgi:hypothetical protein